MTRKSFWTPTGGGTDADAIHDNVSGEIAAVTEKTTPVDADLVLIEDSADSNSKKKVQLGNLPGGGGGSVPQWVEYFAERQAGETSHADDDFFDDGTVGGTAVTVSGSATWTEEYDRMGVLAAGQTSDDLVARLFSLTPSTPPVTIETVMAAPMLHASLCVVGIGFTDGTTSGSNVVISSLLTETGNDEIHFRQAAGTLTSWTADVNADANQNLRNSLGPIFLRLVWSASNTFKWAYAIHPGGPWTDLGVSSRSKTMTPTHFGIVATVHGGSHDLIAAFDYLRVNESDLGA